MSIDPIIEQLRDARKEAGLSQRQVAAWAGINPATLCEAERGKHATTTPKLRRWARALGKDLALVDAAGPGSTSPEPGPAAGADRWPPNEFPCEGAEFGVCSGPPHVEDCPSFAAEPTKGGTE